MAVFEIWHVTDRQTSAPFHDMATRSGPHNKRLRASYFVESNNWRTQSIARPLCNSRAACITRVAYGIVSCYTLLIFHYELWKYSLPARVVKNGTAYLATLSRHHLLIHSNADKLIGSGINKISNMIIQLNIPQPESDLNFTPNKI